MKGAPLTDDDLRAIVEQEIRMGMGEGDDDLSEQRTKSMDAYLGKPYGNEVEGRSQVISTDVSDAIGGIMPSLLEIFCSGDEVVRFDPVGPEDEEGAQQETDYINYVLTKDNNAFTFCWQWFKDALIQKNGVVKVYWDKVTRQHTETYNALPDNAYGLIMKDVMAKEVELVSEEVIGQDPEGLPIRKVILKKSKEYGCPRVEPVPPEEFIISREAKLGEPCRFMGHRTAKTISDLIEMGYDEDKLDEIPVYSATQLNDEALSRDTVGESDTTLNESVINKSMRLVWITEAYVRVDFDGDGIAELRRVVVGGDNANVLLENEPVDDDPFCTITPEIMSHRYWGRSVAELIEDLQLIKTTLQRQMLDNLYLTNAPYTEVVDTQVNLDDLMTRRPGSVIRVKAAGAMREIATPFVANAAFPMLEYLDGVKENRTGVTRYNQGLDANSLNKTASGINQIMSAAQQRIKLIARSFAETGWKQLVQKTHALTVKNQNEQRIIRIRNKFVPVDPRNWSTRYDTTVSVGLGTGDRNMQAQQLMQLLPINANIIAMQGGPNGPLLTLENVYNQLRRLVTLMGFKSVEEFYSDPAMQPPKPPVPPPPDPKLVEIEKKYALEERKTQLQAMKDQRELAQGDARLALDAQIARFEALYKVEEQQQQQADRMRSADREDARFGLDRDLRNFEADRRVAEFDMQGQREDRNFVASREDAAMNRQDSDRQFTAGRIDADRAASGTMDEATKPGSDIAKALERLATGFEALASQVAENTRWVKAEVEIVTDAQGEPVGRRLKPEAVN